MTPHMRIFTYLTPERRFLFSACQGWLRDPAGCGHMLPKREGAERSRFAGPFLHSRLVVRKCKAAKPREESAVVRSASSSVQSSLGRNISGGRPAFYVSGFVLLALVPHFLGMASLKRAADLLLIPVMSRRSRGRTI